MNSISADFRLAVLLIRHSRFEVIVASLGLSIIAIAWLVSQFSLRQPSTVALDVGLSFIRVAVPVFGLLQIQELLSREVDRRQILMSLTYPRSRSVFLVARYGAVFFVISLLTIFLAMILAALVGFVSAGYRQTTSIALGLPYLITITGMLFDFAVVLAFAVALASIATTPNLVFLGGIGFMVIARSTSSIIQLLTREQDLVVGAAWYHQGLKWVQWIVPDLAALDVRPIALYGRMEFLTQPIWALALMAAGYIVFLLLLASHRFERRQFA